MAAAAISDDGRPSVSKIRWKCRRGMLELDFMLERFVEQHYSSLSGPSLERFLELLECEDDQLWDWLSGRLPPDDPDLAKLCEQIRKRN